MISKIVQNDLKGSKLVSLTVFVFILFASYLLSTVGIVAVNLSASVNLFLENAKAPHFLQMHTGAFDDVRMLLFARENRHVLDYQAMPFLNVDASDILVNGERFSENSQDHGFSYQSTNFDFLLDLEGNIAYPEEGEIYIPLIYYTSGILKPGDRISISDRDFFVKGAVRDAQMSSMLSSSKRFLIHPNDYESIKPIGREEMLIEFLLNDLSSIDRFQADYSNANLESNGPTITYSIIRLINALTDGIMIAILFLIAFLIVIVSFLSIRLTLMAKIEDEYKTIGVLKAIGLRLTLIKKIYRAKYALIAFFASLFGFFLSIASSEFFLRNIRLFFGGNKSGLLALIGAFIAAMVVFLLVMLYISFFLRRLKKLSPANAINTGIVSDDASAHTVFKLRKQKLLSTDFFLGLNRILTRKKTYFIFVVILLIASFVMILPNTIYTSLASDTFITYMGLGDGEAMVILPDQYDPEDLDARLKRDPDITNYAVYDHKNYEFILDDHTVSKMWVTLGDHRQFPVLYTIGHAPTSNDEIALSYLNATGLGKEVGDSLTLIVNQQKKDLIISGIYSDITNGGKTARAAFSDHTTPSLIVSIVMNFTKNTPIREKLQSFEQAYPQAKVYLIHSYRDAILGSTLANVKTSGIIAFVLSIGLTYLISLLFVNMLVVKDRHNNSILMSLGFTDKNLREQYMIGSILPVVVSMISGMLLVNSAGQAIAGSFIQAMGVANFTFTTNRLFVFFIGPVCLIATAFLGSHLATRSIREMQIFNYIKG